MRNEEERLDEGLLENKVEAFHALTVRPTSDALLEAFAVGLLAAGFALATFPVANGLRLDLGAEDLGVLLQELAVHFHDFLYVLLVVFTVQTTALWRAEAATLKALAVELHALASTTRASVGRNLRRFYHQLVIFSPSF